MSDYVVVWNGTQDVQQVKAQQRPAPVLDPEQRGSRRPVSPGGFGHSKAIQSKAIDDLRDRWVKERQSNRGDRL